MAGDRPSADELLEAVQEFLVEDAMPALDGRRRFHARVAANAIAIARREMALGPGFRAAERARLIALLGQDGDLATLTIELCRRIEAGEAAGDAVLRHLRQTAREKLEIANPGYLGDDAGLRP